MAATYEIYDGETRIFSGTEREVQERFWLSQNTRVGYYVKTGNLLNKRYRVQRGDCEKTETYTSDFHENTDKYLDYLVRQLSKTHNAGISIDP